MPKSRIYLDHNASAPLRPEARAALVAALEEAGNPSSVHAHGRRMKALLDGAREAVAALLDVAPGRVVFTSGATEANALALQGLAAALGAGRIIHSAIEHDAVRAPARALGLPLTELDARVDGGVDVDAFVTAAHDAVARGERPFVALMLANNETGVVQPVAALAEGLRGIDAPEGLTPILFSDAAQAIGKRPVSFPTLGVHALALSGHKFGGPQGTGALVLAEGVEPRPQLRGGGQERRRRAGTENVAGLAGLGAAAKAAGVDFATKEPERIGRLRDRLERMLAEAVPGVKIIGQDAERLPNTSAVALSGVSAETQVIALDLAGVSVSAGAACSSGKVTQSAVLTAMGIAEEAARSTIRVSLGRDSTEADVDGFLAAYRALAAREGANRIEEMTA